MSYWDDVQALNQEHLIAYWRLNESGGTDVADSSGNGFDGVSTDVTWGNAGIGDGSTAALFNGSSSLIDVYSAGLAGAFDPDAGTLAIWFKMADIDDWNNDYLRWIVNLMTTFADDQIFISKAAAVNGLQFGYVADGTSSTVTGTMVPDTNWHLLMLTWDTTADEVNAFIDAVQFGETQTGLGVWSGASLGSSFCVLGCDTVGGSFWWPGLLAHAALWDVALSQADLAMLLPLITDRTAADITGRTAKAFFNVVDWVRIDGHTTYVQSEILAYTGLDVTLNTLDTPDMTTIPAAADINGLVENIERLRQAASLPAATGIVALDYDYQPGPAAVVPDYADVNAWETDLQLIHELLPYSTAYYISCGVGACGQSHLWQARFRG